ncbi:MAG TPA: efflux RND transporter periplasmic adaptor subunit, partial [Candidatus Acidoferrum sp.]|nr:efflux RND transporter periplasmic adaptor subunit [Candidatus Acidoferrum sp.]
ISGRVGLRLIDVGNIVHAADASGLVVITQVQPIAVQFDLPQENLPAVQKAQAQSSESSQPLAEAYSPDLRTHLASGRLIALDNQINLTSGTFRAKAEFQNQDNALYPNQFVNIRLLVNTLSDQLIMPNAAVQRGAPNGVVSTFVYKVNGDSTVSVQPVTLGVVDGENVVVSEGLAAGDLVVTEGGDRLRDGAKVLLPADVPKPTGTGEKKVNKNFRREGGGGGFRRNGGGGGGF